MRCPRRALLFLCKLQLYKWHKRKRNQRSLSPTTKRKARCCRFSYVPHALSQNPLTTCLPKLHNRRLLTISIYTVHGIFSEMTSGKISVNYSTNLAFWISDLLFCSHYRTDSDPSSRQWQVISAFISQGSRILQFPELRDRTSPSVPKSCQLRGPWKNRSERWTTLSSF